MPKKKHLKKKTNSSAEQKSSSGIEQKSLAAPSSPLPPPQDPLFLRFFDIVSKKQLAEFKQLFAEQDMTQILLPCLRSIGSRIKDQMQSADEKKGSFSFFSHQQGSPQEIAKKNELEAQCAILGPAFNKTDFGATLISYLQDCMQPTIIYPNQGGHTALSLALTLSASCYQSIKKENRPETAISILGIDSIKKTVKNGIAISKISIGIYEEFLRDHLDLWISSLVSAGINRTAESPEIALLFAILKQEKIDYVDLLIIIRLLQAGVDPNSKNAQGQTVIELLHALTVNQIALAANARFILPRIELILLESRLANTESDYIQVTISDDDLSSEQQIYVDAIAYSPFIIVKQLKELSADVLEQRLQREVLSIAGEKINQPVGMLPMTLLMLACWRGYSQMVSVLLTHPQIDIHYRNLTSKTALDYAEQGLAIVSESKKPAGAIHYQKIITMLSKHNPKEIKNSSPVAKLIASIDQENFAEFKKVFADHNILKLIPSGYLEKPLKLKILLQYIEQCTADDKSDVVYWDSYSPAILLIRLAMMIPQEQKPVSGSILVSDFSRQDSFILIHEIGGIQNKVIQIAPMIQQLHALIAKRLCKNEIAKIEREHYLHQLVQVNNYPLAMILIEAGIDIYNLAKITDILTVHINQYKAMKPFELNAPWLSFFGILLEEGWNAFQSRSNPWQIKFSEGYLASCKKFYEGPHKQVFNLYAMALMSDPNWREAPFHIKPKDPSAPVSIDNYMESFTAMGMEEKYARQVLTPLFHKTSRTKKSSVANDLGMLLIAVMDNRLKSECRHYIKSSKEHINVQFGALKRNALMQATFACNLNLVKLILKESKYCDLSLKDIRGDDVFSLIEKAEPLACRQYPDIDKQVIKKNYQDLVYQLRNYHEKQILRNRHEEQKEKPEPASRFSLVVSQEALSRNLSFASMMLNSINENNEACDRLLINPAALSYQNYGQAEWKAFSDQHDKSVEEYDKLMELLEQLDKKLFAATRATTTTATLVEIKTEIDALNNQINHLQQILIERRALLEAAKARFEKREMPVENPDLESKRAKKKRQKALVATSTLLPPPRTGEPKPFTLPAKKTKEVKAKPPRFDEKIPVGGGGLFKPTKPKPMVLGDYFTDNAMGDFREQFNRVLESKIDPSDLEAIQIKRDALLYLTATFANLSQSWLSQQQEAEEKEDHSRDSAFDLYWKQRYHRQVISNLMQVRHVIFHNFAQEFTLHAEGEANEILKQKLLADYQAVVEMATIWQECLSFPVNYSVAAIMKLENNPLFKRLSMTQPLSQLDGLDNASLQQVYAYLEHSQQRPIPSLPEAVSETYQCAASYAKACSGFYKKELSKRGLLQKDSQAIAEAAAIRHPSLSLVSSFSQS